MKRLTLWSLAAFFVIAGCDCDKGEPMDPRCETNADCDLGFECIDNRCEEADPPPTDAGVDTSGDTGGDTNPSPDTSAPCSDLDGDGANGITDTCPDGTDCDDTNADIGPASPEVCGDAIDNDCNGEVDEETCICGAGGRVSCYTGAAGTRGVGACRNGVALCTGVGMPGECVGEQTPGEETCDGTDEDCDGLTDEGLRNSCGECGPEPMEMCGDDIDNDCDGIADEDCECDYRCECMEGTSCDCRPPTNQPCYDGPFGTAGLGICAGGRRDCVADAVAGGNRWTMCEGQITPGTECEGGVANGEDEDCDGGIDEGCLDADMDGVAWPADCDDSDASIFPGATETCNDRDDNCDGVADEGVRNACGSCEADPAETCGNGLDDDCNGTVDDGCTCTIDATQDCYGGPDGTQGVGACAAGTQTCTGSVEFASWSECTGMVLPTPEICDGIDNDCDGEVDERYAVGSNLCGFCDGAETCDEMDNDCDGRTDEGVSNSCGVCGPDPEETCNGADEDCDGIVDEGTTNSCGTCTPEFCYTDIWDMPSDCEADGRDCDGVEPDPDMPDSITLGSSSFDLDYIYVAVTQRGQVAQLNTTTGVKNWQMPSGGSHPSRTAVAIDGSVWVGNRGFTNAASAVYSNVTHLSEGDGSILCTAPVPGLVRGVAIDGDGFVWAGTWTGRRLYKIDPADCTILGNWDAGVNIYGLTVDPDGFVWTASTPNSMRMDPRTNTLTPFPNASRYGIAADGAGNIWHGGWSGGGPIHAIRSADGTVFNAASTTRVTAVTVHPDGHVWGSAYSANQVVKVDPVTGAEVCRGMNANGVNPHGVAVDRMGRIWSPNRTGGYINVFDPDTCARLHSYVVDAGQELYSYSDMSGHLLRTFVAPEGHWSQVFDSGYPTPLWTTLEWDGFEPEGTGIEVTVQTAGSAAGFDDAVPCGPFTESPIDLSTCAIPRARFLRINVRLFRSGTDNRPRFDEARAFWAY